jgi:hypothetical protein
VFAIALSELPALTGPGALHTVVVYPKSTEDVVKVVNISRKYRMPIIPYSGGTSLEGHTRGVRGALSGRDASLTRSAAQNWRHLLEHGERDPRLVGRALKRL